MAGEQYRMRLPNRRPNDTTDIIWQGQRIAVCIGYGPGDRPAEIFARLAKPGSELDLMLDDVSVLLSLLLQHGVEPAGLAHSVGRLHDRPASIVGVLIDLLAITKE